MSHNAMLYIHVHAGRVQPPTPAPHTFVGRLFPLFPSGRSMYTCMYTQDDIHTCIHTRRPIVCAGIDGCTPPDMHAYVQHVAPVSIPPNVLKSVNNCYHYAYCTQSVTIILVWY